MRKRMLTMIGAVLALVVLLALGKYLQVRKAIESTPRPQPETVSTIEVMELEWQPQRKAVGTLTPVRGADLSTEVAGLVRSVRFKSGQDVPAGALLVELIADADIAQLHALQAIADQAAIVLERDQAQLAARAVSQAQVDADLNSLKAARAQVAQQAAMVDKKMIRAPFAGRLGITALRPGQYVNAGTLLVTLQTLDPILVDFTLPQQQLGGLEVGQAVRLDVDGFPGQIFGGQITAISPKVDPSTRNAQVEATIANTGHVLLPGMFVNVNVEVGSPVRHLTLPQAAIAYNPYGSTVFVVSPVKAPQPAPGGSPSAPAAGQLVAHQVFVETGPTRGDQVAILKGLKAGQQVVTSGQIKLKNGTPVVIDNRVEPANDPNPRPQES